MAVASTGEEATTATGLEAIAAATMAVVTMVGAEVTAGVAAITVGAADTGAIRDTAMDGDSARASGGGRIGGGDIRMGTAIALGGTPLIPTITRILVPLAIPVRTTGAAIPRQQILRQDLTQTVQLDLGDLLCPVALPTRTRRLAMWKPTSRVLRFSPLTG